jgi:hypothetical protein
VEASDFIEQVATLAERAAAEGRGDSLFPDHPYLDGGLLPLAAAGQGLSFDDLFARSLKLLIDGVEPAKVWTLYETVARMRVTALEQRLQLQRQALELLAAGTDARLIRTLLSETLRLGSVLVAEAIETRTQVSR